MPYNDIWLNLQIQNRFKNIGLTLALGQLGLQLTLDNL